MSLTINAHMIVGSKPWNHAWRGHGKLSHDIKALMSKLSQSKLGKKLLALGEKKARSQGHKLIEIFHEAETSYTDFTIRRTHSHHIYTQKKIFLDRNTRVKRAVYDMAHELVHYIWQETINPFDHTQKYADYLKNNLEGKGGEVDAVMIECKVAKDLHPNSWKVLNPCKHIISQGEISREKALQTFYKVGHDFKTVKHMLQNQVKEFPHLSSVAPEIIAATSSRAYPVSMLKEFILVRQQLCLKEKSKLQGRAPASINDKKRIESFCQFSS